MLAALLLPVVLQPIPADAKVPCLIEAARYVMRADPSITAQFRPVPRTEEWSAGVAMEIRFAKTGHSYWWLPTPAGTADNHGFRWTARKGTPEAAQGYRGLGDMLYFAFDADYAMRDEGARQGQAAPGHFFLYNMRETFWYRTPYDRREEVVRSLFDLVGCAPGQAREATPDLVFPSAG